MPIYVYCGVEDRLVVLEDCWWTYNQLDPSVKKKIRLYNDFNHFSFNSLNDRKYYFNLLKDLAAHNDVKIPDAKDFKKSKNTGQILNPYVAETKIKDR